MQAMDLADVDYKRTPCEALIGSVKMLNAVLQPRSYLDSWLYFAVSIVLSSPQAVGWAIEDHKRTSLYVRIYKWQFGAGIHLQGCYYTTLNDVANMPTVSEHLAILGAQQSMSHKNDCWNNSPAKRFSVG